MPKIKSYVHPKQHVEMITFCACTRRLMLCSTASDSFLKFHSFLSVLISFALPVEIVWLIKIFQFVFFSSLLLLPFLSSHNWQKCIFAFWDASQRERVIALFQINTFHAIYLLTWMGVFRQTNSWYVVLSASFLCLFFVVVEAIICGHLFVSNSGDKQQDEISYNKLNQSKFLCVDLLCHFFR